MKAVQTTAALLLALAPAAATADDAASVETGAAPSSLTNAAIAEHNAALESRDPSFIRCRRIALSGSLVKKARVCKTNAEWAKSWQSGNQDARDTYDAMNRGSSNSVEPVDEFTAPGAQNRPN
jgi:hypothetical protein